MVVRGVARAASLAVFASKLQRLITYPWTAGILYDWYMVARVMRRTLLEDDLRAIIRVQLIWLDGKGMTLSRVHRAPTVITG
jgi:hypothetical protein